MEKRWIEAVAIGLVLIAGCADRARDAAWSDPVRDDAGGDSGDDAGPGAAGVGAADSSMSVEQCDPGKPATTMPDAALTMLEVDAGSVEGPIATGDDAGIDPGPDAMSPSPTPDSGVVTPDEPRAPGSHGEVIVSELMFDPTVVTDAVGEWIELHNTTAAALVLTGCVISDDRSDDFSLGPLLIPAGGYVVLGRSAEAAPMVDQIYTGMVLANTTDEIVVTCGDVLIDRIAYGTGYPRHAGKTLQLNPDALDAVSNDGAGAWCAGVEGGTPGDANLPCTTN